jgi:hypothetical protein
MAKRKGDDSVTYAGYVRSGMGSGVDTNIAGTDDNVIQTLGGMHTLQGGKTNISLQGVGHSIDSFVDGADLAANNARVEYEKQASRTTVQVGGDAAADAGKAVVDGEALLLAGEGVLVAGAALGAAPGALALGGFALAGGAAAEAASEMGSAVSDLAGNVKTIYERAAGGAQ